MEGSRVLGTWHGGREVDVPEPVWDQTAGGFLGCGFRTSLPAGARTGDPVGHARRLATGVAELFGVTVDATAWAALEERICAVEGLRGVTVVGGWAYALDRSFGAPWTRAYLGRRVDPPAAGAGPPVLAVTLPWRLGRQTATAGLAMLSALEDARAGRLLAAAAAQVGVWLDPEGRVTTTTAGDVLAHLDGRWVMPAPEAAVAGSWSHTRVGECLGAVERHLTAGDLARARCLCFVAAVGEVSFAASFDGGPVDAGDDALTGQVVAAWHRVMRGNEADRG